MHNDNGLRVMEMGDGTTRTIHIDTQGKFPVVIGRNPDADIQIGLLGKRTFIKDAKGNDVPISKCISKIQATIYRYDNGDLRIHDGNGDPSSGGIRIFGCDKPIERPVPLSPGAHIELMPRVKGYYCWLEWTNVSNVKYKACRDSYIDVRSREHKTFSVLWLIRVRRQLGSLN